MPVSLNTGLDETVTLLTLLTLSPGVAHCFNVLCDVSAHGHFRCLWEYSGCLKEKNHCATVWAVSCPRHFFRKCDFTWKKQLTDKLVIQTWVLADIFSKKESLEAITWRKTTEGVCCQWQNPSFQVRILGELCLPLWAWQLSNT